MTKQEEQQIDKEFNIETCIFDNTKEDDNHRAYEPTPYDVLDLLIDSGLIGCDDQIIDMGCGKGRVGFYLSNKLGCHVTGIEYDSDIHEAAMKNLTGTNKRVNVDFINVSAEEYEIKDTDNVFYFFNPFSAKILSRVISKIEDSYYNLNRNIKLIFYYPTLEYVGELTSRDMLDFVDEIDCSELYKDAKGRECIMIFEIGS